jgi:hypothetical protein
MGSCGEGEARVWSDLVAAGDTGGGPNFWQDPATLASLANPNMCGVFGLAGLAWQGRRVLVALTFGDSYSTLSGNNLSGIGSFRLQLYRHVTRETTLDLYAGMHHNLFQNYTCESTNGGAGLRRSFTRRISWSGEAGPEFENCGRGRWIATTNFVTSLDIQAAERTTLAFTAYRNLDAAYLFGAQWSELETAFGNYSHSLAPRTTFEFNSGWLRYPGVQTYFVSPRICRRLNDYTDLIIAYLRTGSETSNAGAVGSRDMAIMTLHWHPGQQSLRRLLARGQ